MGKFLNFFDEVYVINLPRRIDRRVEMEDELMRHGIPFTIFEATENENGAAGLITTMKRLFEHALSKYQENIIVLEDDASFIVPNPCLFLATILPQLQRNYHLFYLGLNLISRPRRMSENILKVEDCYSTHAVCYSKEGMELCLRELNAMEKHQPYDIFIREKVLIMGGAYCTFPMMATQRESYSDIEKAVPAWGKLMAMTFAMHTKFPDTYNTPMAQEEFKCGGGHVIDGQPVWVDPDKHEIQHPELIGRVCDCGKFIYKESLCGCANQRWAIDWEENPNG